MDKTAPPILECISLSKTYGTVKALVDVNLTLRAGEVRALLGKNGAGKSTLVNLISGSQQPDPGSGRLRVSGKEVHWSRPGDARAGGIAMVHQEFSLVPGLSVAENITLGRWPERRGFIDAKTLEDNARRAIEMLGEPIPLWQEVGNLSLAQQQLVEIAKALLDEPRVLILDEPTSALNSHEVHALLALIRRLAGQGVAIIYVSHRMKEIPLVADTLTVLRDGREVQTFGAHEASAEKVAALIAGDSGQVAARIAHRDRRDQPVVLSVRDMHIPGVLGGVDFDLHDGEVLGIAGLLGSGRTELLEAIYGLRPVVRGEVSVAGERILRRRPRRMLARGVGLTPEDRKGSGIVPMLGVGENILLSARGRVLPRFWIKPPREAAVTKETLRALSIVASTSGQEIGTLSGGNQQKAVIGRLLAAKMSVLLLDEPTRGIDVHAKGQIYKLIRELAENGISSIFVSSELEELSEVCDRVLVLRDGRIRDEVVGAGATTEKLLALAMKEGN
ncbi:sugar ABC transporter ATP-binding protein [Nocardia sp. NEAU-G5]|uniref:Sugar ABC transporter ATP-binding protein n=1 Tax=Nocardia albiluteola TaxID=2842303 RepID=A0ABS6BCN2_9NOCA|nr:sugar ABC transporter ATP-binding protein [Nocardia albiluteola]MBU3068052.1 sugar ABC transporter ATP-binding protein [Nocardia albiluteola]